MPPPTPRKLGIQLPRPNIAKPLTPEQQKQKVEALSSFIGGRFMGDGYKSQKKYNKNY